MNLSVFSILCPLMMALVLCSCASTSSSNERKTICNEINSRLTFYGSTSNNREAEIEDSQKALLQRQFEQNHCDDFS